MAENGLPEGWAETCLGDGLVIDVQPGFACGSHNREGEGVPHLRPMNVNEKGEIDLANLKFVPTSEANRDERWVQMGDVLFNNTNSPELVGKTACYRLRERRAFSNHMTRLRCQQEILCPAYCAMLLHQKWREGYFESVCNNHVSQASISRQVLLSTPVLLPPQPEQVRIVAAIEQFLARVNAARERLAKVPLILKRFRQSVLAAACSGRLTADWRVRASRHSGVTQLGTAEQELLFLAEAEDLPDTWTPMPLDAVRDPARPVSYGVLKPGPFVDGGVVLLRIVDILSGVASCSNAHRISAELSRQYRRTILRGGEILVSLVGTIGKVALVPEDMCGANVHRNLAVVAASSVLNSRYLGLVMQSPLFQKQVEFVTTGANQPLFNLGDLKRLVVPVPPKPEQHEIVHRVEALFKLADTIERRVAAATQRADELTQAILAKAFHGELVPTEAELARRENRTYESAFALLERLRLHRPTSPSRARNSRISAPAKHEKRR